MKTVGEILRSARLSRNLTLADVEKATKIREKFLVAIEADDFRSLPSSSYAKGFVKNYADFLGLDSNEVLAFFRRQMADQGKSSILPRGIAEPISGPRWQLTPGIFLALLLISLTTVFLLYLGRQYVRLSKPPTLIVSSPEGQLVVVQKRVTVEGKTDPDATVTINGVSALVRSDGRFFDQVALEEGENAITIVATSRFGKTATATRTIRYQPSQ